jgi:two-component system, OmpR family, sensor histidine kinase TctE
MTRSLRRTLLLWLLLPLLILFSLGTVICYRLALDYAEDAYDRDLQESAFDILQLARESMKSSGRLELPNAAREILMNDKYDKNYFSILDEHGKLLAGDGRLLLTTSEYGRDGAVFYDTVVNDEEVRAVATRLDVELAGQQYSWRILVGETRNKRKTLAKDILTGFVVPQALIIFFAAGLVVLGVRRGLSPLEELRESLARRSHNDMRPLDTPNVPVEVQPLMQEINSLLTRLEAVFDAQKRFIADAAHQLRTPLAGLAAQTDLASAQNNPPKTQHALDQIKIVSKRLNQTVSQLLSLARNEVGAGKSSRLERLDLNAFSREVTLDWVAQAVERKIDLGFEESPPPSIIEGDAPRLREMLDNLIDNALRYCRKGSSVTVRVCEGPCLCVEDDGPGIPQEERARVFERFHRLLGSEADGSGLGLAIVKEIAETHGATVEIENGASGRGTLFRVKFLSARFPA